MKKIRKFFKYKFRYVAASMLVLCFFLFGSLSSAAYSTVVGEDVYSGDDYMPDVGFSVPVTLQLNTTYVYNTTSYFTLSGNITPILGFNELSDVRYTQIRDTAPTYGFLNGFSGLNSSDVTFYNDSDYNLIGSAEFYHTGYKNTLSNDYFNITYLYDYNLIIRDFYIWNNNFDSRITTNSEIDLTFYYGDVLARVSSLDIDYALAGSSEIFHTNIPASNFEQDSESYDVFTFSPSMLGFGDEDLIIYIYQCKFNFDYSFESATISSSRTSLLDVVATYTFNPYVKNHGSPYSPSDPDADNPALPLMSYTTWLGTAVSGFLDLEIFPNFTLGGIFMTILAFTIVVWFLKLVAGG